jgi:hypothetical protein
MRQRAEEMKQLTIQRGRRHLLTVAVSAAGVATGLTFVFAATSSGSKADATQPFSVFRTTPAVSPPSQLTTAHVLRAADFQNVHEGQGAQGKFKSQVLIFSQRDKHDVCFALVAASDVDPAVAACYVPNDPRAPAGIAREHFSVLPLHSVSDDGQQTTQLVGVAFDDVARIRAEAGGQWRPVQLVRNTMYAEFPGLDLKDLGSLEVYLRDGTKQVHDLRTGQPAS